MIETLIGAITLMISYWIIALLFGLIIAFIVILFEWIVSNWLIVLSIVLLSIVVFKYYKSVFNYIKSLNKKLQPKTNFGVRIMMLLNILIYNGFSFFLVDYLLLQIITIGFSIYSLYIFIKPKEYFKIIGENIVGKQSKQNNR